MLTWTDTLNLSDVVSLQPTQLQTDTLVLSDAISMQPSQTRTEQLGGAGSQWIAVVGTATNGNRPMTATVTFTDNSTQTVSLPLTDWANTTAYSNNYQVAAFTQVDNNSYPFHATVNYWLYMSVATLPAGKYVKSVQFPSPSSGQYHIFALSTADKQLASLTYSNAGIMHDRSLGDSVATSNYDTTNNCFSYEKLANAGLNPGQAFSYTTGGTTYSFLWPNVQAPSHSDSSSTVYDNYLANNSVITVNSASPSALVETLSLTATFVEPVETLAATDTLFWVNPWVFTDTTPLADTLTLQRALAFPAERTGLGSQQLGIIGASTNGPISITPHIIYTDGSSADPVMGLTDWTRNGGGQGVSYSNTTVATMTARNYNNNTAQGLAVYLFANIVTLTAGAIVQSVTLPAPGSGQYHVFAITTVDATPTSLPANNDGISHDGSGSAANFDSVGYSYSYEQLSTAGIKPGQTVTVAGLTFTWPNVTPGNVDNIQTSGQVLSFPVARSLIETTTQASTWAPTETLALIDQVLNNVSETLSDTTAPSDVSVWSSVTPTSWTISDQTTISDLLGTSANQNTSDVTSLRDGATWLPGSAIFWSSTDALSLTEQAVFSALLIQLDGATITDVLVAQPSFSWMESLIVALDDGLVQYGVTASVSDTLGVLDTGPWAPITATSWNGVDTSVSITDLMQATALTTLIESSLLSELIVTSGLIPIVDVLLVNDSQSNTVLCYNTETTSITESPAWGVVTLLSDASVSQDQLSGSTLVTWGDGLNITDALTTVIAVQNVWAVIESFTFIDQLGSVVSTIAPLDQNTLLEFWQSSPLLVALELLSTQDLFSTISTISSLDTFVLAEQSSMSVSLTGQEAFTLSEQTNTVATCSINELQTQTEQWVWYPPNVLALYLDLLTLIENGQWNSASTYLDPLLNNEQTAAAALAITVEPIALTETWFWFNPTLFVAWSDVLVLGETTQWITGSITSDVLTLTEVLVLSALALRSEQSTQTESVAYQHLVAPVIDLLQLQDSDVITAGWFSSDLLTPADRSGAGAGLALTDVVSSSESLRTQAAQSQSDGVLTSADGQTFGQIRLGLEALTLSESVRAAAAALLVDIAFLFQESASMRVTPYSLSGPVALISLDGKQALSSIEGRTPLRSNDGKQAIISE